MAVRAVIPLLVGMMLLTGVCNTLLTKYQDMQCVRDCDDPDRTNQKMFEQPVIQTVQMFIGEMGCWTVVFCFFVYRKYFVRSEDHPLLYQPVDTEDDEESDRTRLTTQNASPAMKPLVPNADDRTPLTGWKIILLALPACCDITGTTLMNVGLLFVAASIYQMTRGALVLFVGIFSVLFLKRKLFFYHWLSLVIVVLGVGLVGLAGAIFSGDKNKDTLPGSDPELLSGRSTGTRDIDPSVVNTIFGIFLIAFAQVFTATQFCVEEWILENYALEPLKVVSWEGLFGFIVTIFGQIILHFAVGTTKTGRYGYFDAQEGYREILTNRAIGISSLFIMVSIGGFNFFGLSVTRSISATSRSIIDTCRTLFIWLVSLGLGWESFKWLQVVGFALLVYGTFLFNDLIRPPMKACIPRRENLVGREELLPEEPIEHI